MKLFKKIGTIYKTNRARYWRLQRIVFMSPAEARFVEIMGGKVYRYSRIKSRSNGFPVTLVISLGATLKSEGFKREVRIGRYFTDFCNDLYRVIEIDGSQHDPIADMDRDIYIKDLCRRFGSDARILRIPVYRIVNNPARVQSDVLKFLR